MNVLGIRCSNKDYTYAILTGIKTNPQIIDTQTLPYPPGFSKAESLNWLLQEIEGLVTKYDVKRVVMNKFEGIKYGKSYEDRVEHEAMIYLAAIHQGIQSVSKKQKGSIAKDLGLKGRAQSLRTELDKTLISNYDSYTDKSKDAILAGWSGLS